MVEDFAVNPSHTLFLQPFHNPNNVLVSDLLDGRNYGHRKRDMEVSLMDKNKHRFLQGYFTRPDSTLLNLTSIMGYM